MKTLLLLSFLFLSIITFSQNKEKRDSIQTTQIEILKTDYKDFFVINKMVVYALTKGDTLVSLNPINNSVSILETDVLAITKNSKKRIVAAKKDGSVIEQNENNIFVKKLFIKDKIRRIFLDKNDDYVIITSKNIQYKNQIFVPEKDSPMYKSGVSTAIKGLLSFNYYFLDKEENLWFAYDGGEWGGDVCFFSLKTKQFTYESDLSLGYEKKSKMSSKDYFQEMQITYSDKIKIVKNDTIYKFPYNLNVSSGMKGAAYDDQGNLYVSSSKMHFSIDASILKISKTKNKDFFKSCTNSYFLDGTKFGNYLSIEEYLGPLSFNDFDKKIYYYSSKGFFKLDIVNCIITKEFLFKPSILWTGGLPNAVGYQMNVTKFEFLSKKEIIFLTQKNGIGYFDGVAVKYFK